MYYTLFVPKTTNKVPTVTITIRMETHRRLLSLGKMGSTFDDVITELLEMECCR